MRKKSTVRSARLIRRRGRSGRISTSVPDSLAPSHYPTPRRTLPLSSLLPLFLKDIFNKESRLRPRLIRRFSRRWIPTTPTPLFNPPPPPRVLSLFPLSPRRRWHPRRLSVLSFREGEKEKPAAALPTGKRRGSRFKSRIFPRKQNGPVA